MGFYALLLMYIGFIYGKFCGIFYPEDIKLPIALIVISDLSYGVMCYILLFLLRGRLNLPYYFTRVILPEALYTIVVTMFLYPIILIVNEKLEAKEKREPSFSFPWRAASVCWSRHNKVSEMGWL